MLDILNIISKGESESVEFKKSATLLREGIETICAFANRHGGYLLFGVEDNGNIIGQQVSDDTLKNIANEIKLNTDPKIYPVVEKIEINKSTCILVTVDESPLKPHLAYGRPYLRVGATNQRLDRQQYEHLLDQKFNGYGFDNQIQPDATIKDIDVDALYKFLETANSVRNINGNLMLPPKIILQKLQLCKGNKFTKAAILLFGKNPQHYFLNHFEIKCGSFPADDGYDHIINDQEYNQNIINNYHFALSFILQSINKNSKKADKISKSNKGLYRNERFEFPEKVIRESLVNMIVHRDYRQNIKNTVEIRPSVIKFYNPAQLFKPSITIEHLKQPHASIPGNKLIAKIFYLMCLFENWGSGTLKIVSDTIASGKPEPDFYFEDGMFELRLYR